jgi:hypothetical protein
MKLGKSTTGNECTIGIADTAGSDGSTRPYLTTQSELVAHIVRRETASLRKRQRRSDGRVCLKL